MHEGGELQFEVARKAARRLGKVGVVDCQGLDQEDYQSILWLRGLEAARAARKRRKKPEHVRLSSLAAVWNNARSMARDRNRASKWSPVMGLNLDLIPVEQDLDAQIDAKRVVAVLCEALPPDDLALIEALAENGGVLRAKRHLCWGRSKTAFVRAIFELRERARSVVLRALGIEV